MNFADLRFWATLFGALVVWLVLRGVRGLRWTPREDRFALLLTSLCLFFMASGVSFLVFSSALICNGLLARAIATRPKDSSRWLLAIGIGADVAVLGYFKYSDFFLRDVLLVAVPDSATGVEPAIPPGISFYTFQMIGFLVDTYRRGPRGPEERASRLDFANFVAFFAQIVAGPIERRADLLPQMARFRLAWDVERVALGCRWCILGLFSKLIIADTLAEYVKQGPSNSAYVVAFSVLLFGLRIYFDFAGYSFIAVGLGHLFGLRLSDNFLAPYHARTPREFWQRWHVTLSTWFRDYVYVPLGGNRVRARWLNLMIVFLVSGLWHGASWNFVLWGAYHGALLVGHRMFEGRWVPPDRLAWLITQVLVFGGWLLFMDLDLHTLRADLATLSTPAAYALGGLSKAVPSAITAKATLAIVMMMASLFILAENRADAGGPYARHLRFTPVMVMTFVVVVAVGHRSTEFIYFAF